MRIRRPSFPAVTIGSLGIVLMLLIGLILPITGVPVAAQGTATPPASSPVPESTPVPAPTQEPTAVPTEPPAPFPPDTMEQQQALGVIEDEVGVYGFVVMAADGSYVASINGHTPFVTASTYKLIVLANILQRVEMGWLSLEDTVVLQPWMFADGMENYFNYGQVGTAQTISELLYAMGAWSSNGAARALLDLTSPADLRNTALAMGMEDTYVLVDLENVQGWPPPIGADTTQVDYDMAIEYIEGEAATGPVNLSTPDDMATYMLGVANDTLISPWVSQQIGSILARQAIRDRIPAYLDGRVMTINKPGNLIDAVNDIGVIYLDEGPRAVALMAEAVPNPHYTADVEAYLALIAAGFVTQGPSDALARVDDRDLASGVIAHSWSPTIGGS